MRISPFGVLLFLSEQSIHPRFPRSPLFAATSEFWIPFRPPLSIVPLFAFGLFSWLLGYAREA
jgi:hypothetical protein